MKSFEIQRCVVVKESVMEYDAAEFTVTCSDDVARIGRKLGMGDYAEEHFAIFCLSARGGIIAFHDVSHGDLTSSSSHPRDVFKRALINNAASIILMHVHPSGDSNPSQADIGTTKRLMEAGEILGVPVIDHIILGDQDYTSMKAEGLMA